MKRREPESVTTAPPSWYVRYRAEDWPDGPQGWYDAREAWRLEHPEDAAALPLLLGLAPEDNPPDVPLDAAGL